MRDDALLRISDSPETEYTPEARRIIEAEINMRGGLEALRERVNHAEQPDQSIEELARVRRFLIITVIAGCGLTIFAFNGSSWFYWICLFALIAALFTVLFNPPANPEDEIKELLEKAKSEDPSTTPESENNESSTPIA